jgi:hypothetical protein
MVSPELRLTNGGVEIDTSPSKFGWLRDSSDSLGNVGELRRRMDSEGYVFLPGFLERNAIANVRREICEILAADGCLDDQFPPDEAVAKEGVNPYFRPDIANNTAAGETLREVIYGERMMRFFDQFLGGRTRHYDFTWLRVIGPGGGTNPHCDVVYMGRGTKNLYTAWVPFGDVPLNVGGLILKEGSHLNPTLRSGYCTLDVDTRCENHPAGTTQLAAQGLDGFGALAKTVSAVEEDTGGRWLTFPEFRMGDLLLFSIFTVHGSVDNQSQRIRISSDSRYQLASDPVDERWVGEQPPGHGGESLIRMIC